MISLPQDGVIQLDGRLDIDGTIALRDALIEQFSKGRRIALHLAGVLECDGAGVQLLLAARAHAAARAIALDIVSPSPAVCEAAASLGFPLEEHEAR